MWDTKTSDYSIMNTPFGRDVVKEVSAACKKHKMAFCLYYSIADFYHPDCIGANHANGMYLGPKGYALPAGVKPDFDRYVTYMRSEEHTSELQSLMRISYAVFCLKKKIKIK